MSMYYLHQLHGWDRPILLHVPNGVDPTTQYPDYEAVYVCAAGDPAENAILAGLIHETMRDFTTAVVRKLVAWPNRLPTVARSLYVTTVCSGELITVRCPADAYRRLEAVNRHFTTGPAAEPHLPGRPRYLPLALAVGAAPTTVYLADLPLADELDPVFWRAVQTCL